MASVCYDAKETPQEKAVADEIVSMLVREDIRGALARLDASGLRPRMYKMEMVLLQMMLDRELRQPCLRLWAEDWNLTPMQKFVILKSFWNALFLNIPRSITEQHFAMISVFRPIRTLPHARGILERLSIALGNQEAEARLLSYPAAAGTVQRCRLNRHLPFTGLSALKDYPRWVVPPLDSQNDLGLRDRPELPFEASINHLSPRRIPVPARFPGDSLNTSGTFPGDVF